MDRIKIEVGQVWRRTNEKWTVTKIQKSNYVANWFLSYIRLDEPSQALGLHCIEEIPFATVDAEGYTIAKIVGEFCDLELASPTATVSIAPITTSDHNDWKAWRDNGLEPGYCVCRCPKSMCDYHRDDP